MIFRYPYLFFLLLLLLFRFHRITILVYLDNFSSGVLVLFVILSCRSKLNQYLQRLLTFEEYSKIHLFRVGTSEKVLKGSIIGFDHPIIYTATLYCYLTFTGL